MANTSVKVKGLREVQRGLRNIGKEAAKDFRDEFKVAAEPVRAEASRMLARFPGASTRVTTHVLGRGVFVRQAARKRTGLRPDFGATQMEHVFIPALEQHRHEIVEGVSKAIDRIADKQGLRG